MFRSFSEMTQAFVLMILGIAALSVMDAFAKRLQDLGVSVLTMLFLRGWALSAVLFFHAYVRGQMQTLAMVNIPGQCFRSATGIGAPLCFFLSLSYLSLSDAVVMFFTGALFVSIASVFFLKEKLGIHRWTAIVVGFIGVYIAMQPSGEGEIFGYVLALIGSLCYAVLFTSGRYLSRTETTVSLVLYYNLGIALVSTVLLPWYWTTPALSDFFLLIVFSALGLLGHFAVTQAFAKGEASLLVPIEYTALFWAVLLDYFLFEHTPVLRTLQGGSLTIVALCYAVHRERVRARRLLSQAPPL